MSVKFIWTMALAVTCGGFWSSSLFAQEIPRVASTNNMPAAAVPAPKFTFILFWKEDNAAAQGMAAKLKDVVAAKSQQVEWTAVQVSDPANKAIVDRYRVSRAPMPMVLCVASNGAITGAMPDKLSDEAVAEALVTPAMTDCMKALQEGKLVLVHVKAAENAALPNGARDFAADPANQARTAMISFRRDDPNEARFLSEMKIEGPAQASVVSLLAPPGVVVGKYPEGVTKEKIAADLHAAGKCCNDANCKHNKKGN